MLRVSRNRLLLMTVPLCLQLTMASIGDESMPKPTPVTLADRVLVIDGGSKQLGNVREIVSREIIVHLAKVIVERSDAWKRPAFESPRLQFTVQFFKGNTKLGEYGVGSNFLEMNGLYQPFEPSERRHLDDLLDANK